MLRALQCSNNSSPGIPFRAWRRIGGLAATVLFEAFQEMVTEQGMTGIEEYYDDFNESLSFLPPPEHHKR